MGQEKMGRMFEAGMVYKIDLVHARKGQESVMLEGHFHVRSVGQLPGYRIEVIGEIIESGEKYALRIGRGRPFND